MRSATGRPTFCTRAPASQKLIDVPRTVGHETTSLGKPPYDTHRRQTVLCREFGNACAVRKDHLARLNEGRMQLLSDHRRKDDVELGAASASIS
jgi:hypothetical protein